MIYIVLASRPKQSHNPFVLSAELNGEPVLGGIISAPFKEKFTKFRIQMIDGNKLYCNFAAWNAKGKII